MAWRRLEMLVMVLAVLAGPQRCCCGIRTTAAEASQAGGEAAACCSCCTIPGKETATDSGEGLDGAAGHRVCACAGACEGSQPDDGGCPSRGKPRQAWDSGTDGHAAKFRPALAIEPWVGVSPATSSLVTASSRVPLRHPGERNALGGRDLLLRLQILRC